MTRWILFVTALMLATTSVVSASDIYEEALAEHYLTGQDQDDVSKDASCDVCCHCHLWALRGAPLELVDDSTGRIEPLTDPLLASWPQTPPTPPPDA